MRQARRRHDMPAGWALLAALACVLAVLAGAANLRRQGVPQTVVSPAPAPTTIDGSAGSGMPLRSVAPVADQQPFELVLEPPVERQDAAGGERQDSPRSMLRRALGPKLGKLLRRRGGRFGVVIEDVSNRARLEHNPRKVFEAASVYKLPLAYEVLRWRDAGWLTLDDRFTILPEDALEPEPDGGPAPGEDLTIRQALRLIMTVSSNSASHALLRQLGRAEFNTAMGTLGLHDTRVPVSADRGESATTTAADMASLLRRLVREELLTDESRRALADLLALPEPQDPLVDLVPDQASVYSKVGNLEDASNVAGVITTPDGPLIVSIFDRETDPGVARAIIADLVEAVLEAQGQ